MRSLILICLALPVLSACGSSDAPSVAPSESAGPAESTTVSTATDAPETGVAGDYAITGTNADGSTYRGTLSVEERRGAYAFEWEAGRSYTGLGVQQGDVVAVGFGAAGCGAAAYRMTSGGLDGVWAMPSVDGPGTERATRTAGTAGEAPGAYTTAGANADGAAYTGALEVDARGNAYALAWNGADGTAAGIGLVEGDVLGSSYGPDGCGVALYRAQPDGGLVGTWTDASGAGPGTERAVRA